MGSCKKPLEAFNPSELAMLQAAYDDACRDLQIDPNANDGGAGYGMRHALAAALIAAAETGERNPRRLKVHALSSLKAAQRRA